MTPSEFQQTNRDNPRFVLSGTTYINSNGLGTNYHVVHSCGLENYQVFLSPLTDDALTSYKVTIKSPDLFVIEFSSPPPAGTGNLGFDWLLVKVMTANIE